MQIPETLTGSSGKPRIEAAMLRSPKIARNLIKIAKANTQTAENEKEKDRSTKIRRIFIENWRLIVKQYLDNDVSGDLFILDDKVEFEGVFSEKITEMDRFETPFSSHAKGIFIAANRFIRKIEEIEQRENIYGFAGATPSEVEGLYLECFGVKMLAEFRDEIIDLCCEDERLEYEKDLVEVYFAGRDLMVPSREWSIDIARNLDPFDFERYVSIARQWWSIYRKSAMYLLRLLHETTRGLGMPIDPDKDKEWTDETDYTSLEWLEAAYDALVRSKYMPAAKNYLPHRDDLHTLQYGFGALLEEVMGTETADPLIIKHREEHPGCKFFRIGDEIAKRAREIDPIDKKSWAELRICRALLKKMTKRVEIDGTMGPEKRKDLEIARDTLINKLEHEGFEVLKVREDGTVVFGFTLQLPDGRDVPMRLIIAPIKSDLSIERKGGGKNKRTDEILDGLRMRFEILDDELDFEISENDIEKITVYSYAFMLDIAGEDLPSSMHKHLKYQHSGSEHSDQFLASKLFVETSAREIKGDKLYKIVTRAEVQIGLKSSFPDNHASYVKNMFQADRDRLGITSYKKSVVNDMDYLCMNAPKTEEDWREIEEYVHHPMGSGYCRQVSILIRTFLNPEGHHFRMITGHHYLPDMVKKPDTAQRIKEIMRLIRKWPDKFRGAGFDPEEALNLLDELIGLCEMKYEIYNDPRFPNRDPNGLIQQLWDKNLSELEVFREKLKGFSWTGKRKHPTYD